MTLWIEVEGRRVEGCAGEVGIKFAGMGGAGMMRWTRDAGTCGFRDRFDGGQGPGEGTVMVPGRDGQRPDRAAP